MERGIDITDEVVTKLSLIIAASQKVIRTFFKDPNLFIEAEFQTIISLKNPHFKYIHFRLIQFQTGDTFQLREDVLVKTEVLKFKSLFLLHPENYTVRKNGDQILIDIEPTAKFLEEV